MPNLVASSLAEGGMIGGMKIPKPMSNTYNASASTVVDAVKSNTAVSGHNVFRPDIYRVSEGSIT
jgi:hypothetical protein